MRARVRVKMTLTVTVTANVRLRRNLSECACVNWVWREWRVGAIRNLSVYIHTHVHIKSLPSKLSLSIK